MIPHRDAERIAELIEGARSRGRFEISDSLRHALELAEGVLGRTLIREWAKER